MKRHLCASSYFIFLMNSSGFRKQHDCPRRQRLRSRTQRQRFRRQRRQHQCLRRQHSQLCSNRRFRLSTPGHFRRQTRSRQARSTPRRRSPRRPGLAGRSRSSAASGKQPDASSASAPRTTKRRTSRCASTAITNARILVGGASSGIGTGRKS